MGVTQNTLRSAQVLDYDEAVVKTSDKCSSVSGCTAKEQNS